VKTDPVWPALLSFAIPIIGASLGYIVAHDIFAWLGLFGGIAVAALSGAKMLWARIELPKPVGQRKDVPSQLAAFIAEAEQLKADLVAWEDLAELDPEVNDWRARVTALVRERLGEAFAIRVFSDPDIRGGEPFGLSAERLGRWRWLNYRTHRLQELAAELAPAPAAQ